MTRIDKVEMMGFKSFAKKTQVLFPTNFSIIAGPNGSGKSARYSTEVILSNGEIRQVGEIIESALEKSRSKGHMDDGVLTFENPEDIEILSLNPRTMKVEKRPIGAFIKREGEPFLYRISTKTGRSVETTACHPILCFKDMKIASKRADELETGNMIATPKKLPDFNNEIRLDTDINSKRAAPVSLPPILTPELARLLGYILGDGHIREGKFDVTNSQNGIIEDISYLTKYLFNKSPSYFKSGKSTRVIANSVVISGFIRKFLKNDKPKSHNKAVPEEFLFAHKDIICNFLGALFDCDGTVDNEDASLEFSTKSKKLAKQVQFMLLRLGIVPKLNSKLKRATNSKKKKRSRYYSITADGINNLRKFRDSIRLLHPLKSARLDRHCDSSKKGQRTYEEVLPKEAIEIFKRIVKYLAIRVKNEKKTYPFLAAYMEERCKPTTNGIKKVLPLFETRLAELEGLREGISAEKTNLVEALKTVRIYQKEASASIGMKSNKISYLWRRQDYMPPEEELKRLHKLIGVAVFLRCARTRYLINILKTLCDSDILWDEVTNIEKVEGDEWVYDLYVPETNNFIGDLIFVHNSNTLDAVCFVLGRTSAKSIRADKMSQIIFNGGKKTPAMDTAKVAITFDNSEKKIPLEEDKVTISRKVNRNGVSIYKINGRTVNRESVLEVLRAVNIFPDGHNIILQGDITEVIEMSPLERREIIDQISGIREFDDKREKAVRELLVVEERLKESLIILGEREMNLKILERESRAAEEYNQLSAELQKLESSLVKKKLTEATSSLDKMNEKIGELSIENLDRELKAADEELESLEKERKKISKTLVESSKGLEAVKKVEKLKAEVERRRDKIQYAKSAAARADEMIKRIEEFRRSSQSSNRALSEIKSLDRTGVHGVLSDLCDVPEQHRVAIEVAAGNHLNDIVVSNVDTATECINHLKKNKIGRATFLPLDKIRPREGNFGKLLKEKGVVGPAIELIEFDKKFYNAFSFAIGDTLVVDDLGTAKRLGIGNARYVTLDGQLVEKSGAMIGGFYVVDKRVFAESEQIKKLEEEKAKLKKEMETVESELPSLEKELEMLLKTEPRGAEKSLDVEKDFLEIEGNMDRLRNRRRELYDRRLVSEEQTTKWKERRARLEAELDQLKAESGKYSVKEFYDLSTATLENKAREMAKKRDYLLPINMKALDEFRELKRSYDELKGKVDILTNERQKVLFIVGEVEGKRKEVFYKTLMAVSEEFKRVYVDLMGSEGEIKLEEPEDIESGLLIEVRKAGRTINIDSLSGGEKTLTALGFLFALQNFKPSPFYVLDEVDAALDKVNTKKMINLIQKYSKKSQFVVISHNDATITAADCVYGVSMSEGESRVVSIKMPS
ncbi:MAG TPA: LAGLIDADG family homing endonuclease [archaeon]|nr:LAGLIDADG family homing endonuclease [archaeon]